MKRQPRINSGRADRLYVQLLAWLTARTRYRSKQCSQRDAAEALGISTYTLSAAVSQSTGRHYTDIVNTLRLRDACAMLSDPKFAEMTAEDIGLTVGFASRQAFYVAFSRHHHVTPQQYRELQSEA
ncbi:MAG: AraC family transcriptional regulator [Bacteroidaceae bacterium]|nr:AraC family transcriptional regulator [Bacteroidaceae bacterium]